MLYLVCTVIVSSLVPSILKYARKNQLNADYIILVNYLFAAVSAGIAAYQAGLFGGFSAVFDSSFTKLFAERSEANTYLLVLLVGICSGILYCVALMLTRSSVVDNGMGITSMFSRLSFLVTLTVSALVWREIPGVVSMFGVILGLLPLLMTLWAPHHKKQIGRVDLLLFLFLSNGIVELNNKIVVVYSVSPAYKSLFVCIIYEVALLVCAGFLFCGAIKKKSLAPILPREVLLGIALGLPNAVNSFLLLKALEVLPAALVYATTASGGVLMSSAIGVVFFKESLRPRQKIAIALTVGSLILINIG